MQRTATLFLLVLLIASQGNAALAQAKDLLVITVNVDGTCAASRVHVPCREIGTKLRQAGVPLNTRVRLHFDKTVVYEILAATLESVRDAGLDLKLGYVIVEKQ